MFGYVKTDMPNMYVKDTVLYQAMYCGLCKGLGKACGQKARFVLNYDLTFLSVLLHNLKNIDVKVEKQHCVIHPIRKKPIAEVDELTERIACLNVILAYYKLNDDVIDNNKGKLKRAFFKKSYKIAKKKEPKIDKIVKERYDGLLSLEKANCDSIDRIADPFGLMMQEIIEVLLQDDCNEKVKELAYYIGKWIYLIDALDDFDKDKKKGDYNVFVNAYLDIQDKQTLVEKHGQDIMIVFASVISKINQLTSELDYKFNHDLTDNILYRGIISQTKNIMENKKCKNTSKF